MLFGIIMNIYSLWKASQACKAANLVPFGCALQPAPMVVIKSTFHRSINGFNNVGLSHPDIIGQHFIVLQLSSSFVSTNWLSICIFLSNLHHVPDESQFWSKYVHPPNKNRYFLQLLYLPGVHAILPTHAVPVWIPDKQPI